MRYLTTQELKRHLNIDIDEDDLYLEELGTAAEQAVENFIQQPLRAVEECGGQLPAALLHAIKLQAGVLYANREAVSFGQGYIVPLAFYNLVVPYIKYR